MLSQESMLFRSFSTKIAVALLAGMLVAATAPAFARPQPTPTPTATPSPPPEDPAVTKIARREFVLWQAGNVDLSRYSNSAKAQITPEKITVTSKNLGLLGALVRSEYVEPVAFDNEPAGVKAYIYRMICTDGIVYEQIVLDAAGKVTGIVFRNKLPE